ncbi:hypothetical protein H4R20_004805 [Coemansia guatemalensis]|uniref:RING-type domain-containing protein n=1 Tax=Coemansia guatemalensis TaxID=2761395 RepID=A0A9W8HRH1_9FUNG|nr:hypothetical protein H4R20_004805 [Coemansia guatemalensis]
MRAEQLQTRIKIASILGVLYGAVSSATADILEQNKPATAPHSNSGNGLLTMRKNQEHSTFARAREGLIPASALRTSDSLSDTKIFVLLAAIVFVFLLALGVAMTRVSRGRRRQHNEEARHHIIAANAPPQTLNKTILDLLPVFEVTERRQLRQIHTLSPTPGAALSERFAETGLGCSSAFTAGDTNACEGTAQWMVPRKIHAPMGGYGLDSGKSSLCSVLNECHLDVSGGSASGHSYGSNASVLTSNHGAVELTEAKKRSQSPLPRSARGVPFAVEAPAPAAFRRHGRSATRSATPPTSGQRSASRGRWDSLTPDYGVCAADMNIGSIFYRERSSRSLDLASERELSEGTATTQQPCAAWMGYQSQPEIAGGAPCRMSSTSGGEADAGSCPICLEEFEAGEQLRELPCMHRYHVVCIDTWLVSRSTCCPYCKLDIRRWYYGPDIEDAIPHSGPLAGTGPATGHREAASPADGVLVGPDLESGGGSSSSILGRRPRHIERRRAGQTRLARVWRTVRGALVE